jgi:predicted MFS family arabinose efflux permease
VRRPAVLLLYLTIFAGEAIWSAIVPLVPEYSQRLSLSTLEAGMLLGCASVAILLVSMPAGLIGERMGVRRVTVAAVALMAVADAGQAAATSFPALLAARTLFGVAFGVLWTAGIAWLTRVAGARQAQALSLTVTTAGLGGVAGPALAGVLGQRFGLGAPFLVAAAVTAGLAVALAFAPSGERPPASASLPVREVLRSSAVDPRVSAGLLLMGMGGLLSSTINLLVPLSLHRAGISTGAVGAVFAVSAAAFIVSSATVARLGDRAVRIGVGMAACGGAAVVLAIPLISGSAAAAVGLVLARSPVAAVMFTVSFPLAVAGARARGVAVGAVAALLNMVWAVSALAGPVAGGAVAEAGGNGAAYGVLLAMSLAVAGWLWAGRSRAATAEEHGVAPCATHGPVSSPE